MIEKFKSVSCFLLAMFPKIWDAGKSLFKKEMKKKTIINVTINTGDIIVNINNNSNK